MDNRLFTAIVAAALCVVAFLMGASFKAKNGANEPLLPKVDTLIIRDTIRLQAPVLPAKTVYLRDTLVAVVRDTLRDTVTVALPLEQVEVRDSLYTAWISGWHPRLDSIELHQATQMVTIREQLPSPRWSFGIQGGYGITPAGLQPYLGVGFSYRMPIGNR